MTLEQTRSSAHPVSEADLLDQLDRDDSDTRPGRIPLDVPERDALEQSRDAELEDDRERF